MNLPEIGLQDFTPLFPALLLSLGACVLLLSEVFLVTPARGYQAVLALVFTALAGVAAALSFGEPARSVFQDMAVLDPFSSFLGVVICLGTFLSVLVAASFLHERSAERGEFYALMLFAAAGMCLLSISSELVTLFISLEVLSVATYALAAYLRKGTRPSEAGFKYFILGAFSTALLLYGVALLYGATGTTKLSEMGSVLPQALGTQPLLVYLGAGFIAAGFAFKVAAVPFHMWTPDVYEGAPTPVTALMSAGVKAAAFAAMVRVFVTVSQSMDPQLPQLLFSGLALLTMLGGNLLALPQRNVKRMLAYSSIAHAGYLLVGVASLFAQRTTDQSVQLFSATPMLTGGDPVQALALKGILFYLLGYTVTAVGAFATLSALERREDEERGTAWDLDRFAGLAQRRPGYAWAMAAFMLSLGGVPPTVGFIGKLFLFQGAIEAGLLGLCIVGMLTSAAAVYYYLRVVVYMFMRPSVEGALTPTRKLSTDVAVWACTMAVVVLGVLPGLVSSLLGRTGLLWK
jgi:NADH-quinone oxidoreductase subunit N